MMLVRYLSQIGRYFIMLKDLLNRPVKVERNETVNIQRN